jgi:H+-transporting ATPase
MVIFGVFGHQPTSVVALIRVWVFSVGVVVILGIVYNFLQNSQAFDDLMHGRSPRARTRERSWEDFCKSTSFSKLTNNICTNLITVLSLQRVSTQHEKTT